MTYDDSKSMPATSMPWLTARSNKSIIIPVPKGDRSYDVSDATIKISHSAIAKKSGGNINAYLGNMVGYDKSRKFVKEYTLKAASHAASLCKVDDDFPE